jgi:uncharacterized protein YkwD
MKVRFTIPLVLFSVLAVMVSITPPQTTRSQAKKNSTDHTLSDAESDLLNEINLARAHPQTYASYLEKLKPLFSGKQYTPAGRDALITEEGWAAVDDAIKFLRAATPVAGFSTSRGLSLAALAHCKDQGGTGGTGHRGADSTFIEQRVKPFGSWQGGIGENIAYGNDSARERLLTWLIDDGFPSRGHRRRLLSTDYKVAGVSCGPHPEFGAMCVLTMAGGFSDAQTASTTTTSPSPTKPKTTVTKARKL